MFLVNLFIFSGVSLRKQGRVDQLTAWAACDQHQFLFEPRLAPRGKINMNESYVYLFLELSVRPTAKITTLFRPAVVNMLPTTNLKRQWPHVVVFGIYGQLPSVDLLLPSHDI